MNRFACLAAALLLGVSSLAAAAPSNANPPFIKGQVVVKGSPSDFPGQKVIKYLPLSGLTVLAVEPGREMAALARQRWLGHQAMLNLQAQAFADVNDPYYANYDLQWNFDRIQAPSAWDISNGAGVTVAVLDTGFATGGKQQDAPACVLSGYNALNGTTDTEDGNGHGTHVSGTIAEATNNGIGVAGIANGACILPVKVLSDQGSGGFADIAEGILWAVNNGAQVINMSLGVSADYGLRSDPVMDPALQEAYNQGVTVVVASGNDGNASLVSYPAIYPTTIAVGATGYDNAIAPYSNQGDGLTLVAPGGNTAQDLNSDGYGDGIVQETKYRNRWGYYFFQGTSMASPHVAAAAALLLAQDSGLSPADIKDKLTASALDLGIQGYDSIYGSGLIQLSDALSSSGGTVTVTNHPPTASFLPVCNDLSCEFTSTSYDSDSDTLSYSWSFGDNTGTATGEVVTHTFAVDGTYDVTLSVDDGNGGSDAATQAITVFSSIAACTDADGDGYCADVDCDDSDPTVYPGHPDKGGRWGKDGKDNDCNGVVDG